MLSEESTGQVGPGETWVEFDRDVSGCTAVATVGTTSNFPAPADRGGSMLPAEPDSSLDGDRNDSATA
jgi:hypothetical protein